MTAVWVAEMLATITFVLAYATVALARASKEEIVNEDQR